MPDTPSNPSEKMLPSLLPFDPADLVAMRVRPAEFARMAAVSKQTVSQWIKQGKVTLGPDGKLDPAKASREVLAHSDPGRLRARVFKSAMANGDELRASVRQLKDELARLRSSFDAGVAWAASAARNRCMDMQALQLVELQDALLSEFQLLTKAQQAGSLEDRLDQLIARVFYPDALADAADAGDNSTEAAKTPQEDCL